MERELDILFVNQHYGDDAPATGVLLKQLATSMSAMGVRVGVLTSAEETSEGGIVNFAEEGGVQLIRVRAASAGNKSTPRRLLHYASFFAMALWAGLRLPRPARVVAMSTPPLLALLLGRILGASHKAPVYYNVQDLYPDVAIAVGKVPHLLQRPVRVIAGRLETGLTGISTVGLQMQKVMRSRSRLPVVQISNWADAREVQPLAPTASFRHEWGLAGRFVVQYAGNLGLCHDVELIAEVVELLRNQPIDFLFVGTGAARPQLEQLLPRDCRVHFRPFEPRENLSRVLATADVGWVNLAKGMSRYLVPSKAFGILAAGRPVLAVSDLHDDLYRVVRDHKVGVWAQAGDATAVSRAILRLHHDTVGRRQMGLNARRFAEDTWNRDTAVDAWCRWLDLDAGSLRQADRKAA